MDHQFGPGSSPVLWRYLLVLVRDGNDVQYVTALNKQTGQTVWKTARPPINADSPIVKKSFITPLLLTSRDRIQLVCPGAHWVVSYHPMSGKELWPARHREGFPNGSSPVFSDGLAISSTGHMEAQFGRCARRRPGRASEEQHCVSTLLVVDEVLPCLARLACLSLSFPMQQFSAQGSA